MYTAETAYTIMHTARKFAQRCDKYLEETP